MCASKYIPYNRFFMHVYYLCILCESRSCCIRIIRINQRKQTTQVQAHAAASASYDAPEVGEVATREANKAVTEELRRSEAKQTRKRKAYSVFSGEQHAQIGKYAAENGNTAAVKRFKVDYDGQLEESTV